MTRAAWLVAIGAALLSALVTWLFSRRGGARDPEPADVAPYEARISQLERELASARSTPPPVSAGPAPTSQPTLAGSKPPPATPSGPLADPPAPVSAAQADPDIEKAVQFALGNGEEWLSKQKALDVDPAWTLDDVRRLLASRSPVDHARALAALAATRDPSWIPTLREVANAGGSPQEVRQLLPNLANLKDKQWSAKQLTGEPDTPIDGDLGTAWASKREDMGEVWLELDYGQAVRVDGVRIHETFNPGAVSKVLAKAGDGTWDVLWEGRDPSRESPAWFEPYVTGTAYRTTTIRVVLDTDRIPGWNEIDAVELTGDGFRQWAKDARASSSYSDP